MAEPLIDLAHRKPATQSSHSQWSRGETAEDDASLAVSGYLLEDYAFHTHMEQDPWWQVDLQEQALIESIDIVNRAGVPGNFRRFRIDASADGAAWRTCFVKDDDEPVSSDPAAPGRFVPDQPFVARYLRIVQFGLAFLHLRRVRVFGLTLAAVAPAVRTDPTELVADVLGSPLFAGAVASVVNRQMFGLSYDSYNIDALAALAAGIDSSHYAVAHMAKAARCHDKGALFDQAIRLTPPAGLILEFGVFSGQTINYLAERLHTRTLHGFDSFKGLPETWRAGFETGAFARTDLPPVHANVELVVGWFDRTLPSFLDAHPDEPVALLHVDCDLYSSTQTVFAQCAERIVPGTVILFDEYLNYPGWRLHEFKAFQEFVASRGIHYDYIGLVPNHQQVAVRIVGVR